MTRTIFDDARRSAWRLRECAQRAPVVRAVRTEATETGLRVSFQFAMRALARTPFKPVVLAGPINVRMVDKMKYRDGAIVHRPIVTLRGPLPIYHPGVSMRGMPCLGAIENAWANGLPFDIEALVLQLFDGMRLLPRVCNLAIGAVLNAPAALFVKQNLHRIPLSPESLYEASPLPNLEKRPIIALQQWIPAESIPNDRAWQRILARQCQRRQA